MVIERLLEINADGPVFDLNKLASDQGYLS